MIRGLTFSAGGSHGAWEVSQLQKLVKKGNEYSVYGGVSAGALNAAFISQYEDLFLATSALINLWSGISTKSIYRNWNIFGPLNVLWKKSLYNSSPLRALIDRNISLASVRATKKKVFVGATNINSGLFEVFDGDTNDNFIPAVKASCAFPFLFEPVKIGNALYIDGGVRDVHLIKPMIDYGCDEIDIISTQPLEVSNTQFTGNALKVLEVSMGYFADEVSENELKMCNMYNLMGSKKDVKIRVFRPEKKLSEDAMNFDNGKILRLLGI
jgi:NTE family protein